MATVAIPIKGYFVSYFKNASATKGKLTLRTTSDFGNAIIGIEVDDTTYGASFAALAVGVPITLTVSQP